MSKPNKTVQTDTNVSDYVAAIADDARRNDIERIVDMMACLSGEPARMWGTSIIGFGSYHYVYDSGREGDAVRTGVASRARDITIYIMPGYLDLEDKLARLGKHRTGKSCLYIKRLSDVDEDVLEEIIAYGLSVMDERYPR